MSEAKAVLVTGASSGIGRACALDLDRRGFRVFAGVRKEADGESLAGAASSRLQPLILDITDRASIDSAVTVPGEALFGLVNNAGISVAGPLEYLPLEDIRHQFEVNVFGHLAVTQAFLPQLRAARGRIVFVSSVAGLVRSTPFLSPYAASKHAIESFADSLRVELRPSGVHVSLIEPGSVATPIWEKGISAAGALRERLAPEAEERYGAAAEKGTKIAAATGKRGIAPERVAEAVAEALTAAHPKPRYPVGIEVKVQRAAFALLSDRLGDRLMAKVLGLTAP
ncbi:MAG: SDR family oxidoreductase [Actinomycetota bacterium]